MLFTKRTASAAATVDRVQAARDKIAEADRRVPELRVIIERLDAEIRALFGQQIATGTDVMAQVADLRADRYRIQSEIDELEATAVTLRSGMAAATRLEWLAKAEQQRAKADSSRRSVVRLCKEVAPLLRRLWDLDAALSDALDSEWSVWRAELELQRQATPDGSVVPPHSGAPERTGDVLGTALLAVMSYDSTRLQQFERALDRIVTVGEGAARAIATSESAD